MENERLSALLPFGFWNRSVFVQTEQYQEKSVDGVDRVDRVDKVDREGPLRSDSFPAIREGSGSKGYEAVSSECVSPAVPRRIFEYVPESVHLGFHRKGTHSKSDSAFQRVRPLRQRENMQKKRRYVRVPPHIGEGVLYFCLLYYFQDSRRGHKGSKKRACQKFLAQYSEQDQQQLPSLKTLVDKLTRQLSHLG